MIVVVLFLEYAILQVYQFKKPDFWILFSIIYLLSFTELTSSNAKVGSISFE